MVGAQRPSPKSDTSLTTNSYVPTPYYIQRQIQILHHSYNYIILHPIITFGAELSYRIAAAVYDNDVSVLLLSPGSDRHWLLGGC